MTSLEIRPVDPSEYEALGDLTLTAYAGIDADALDDGYADELRDVACRARDAVVLVAVEGHRLLGGVTYVPGPESPLAEYTDADAAGIRMLAVDPAAQGRGVGAALSRACVERARDAGRSQVLLHSTDRMTTAHRLYTGLGFERDPSLDWEPVPGLWLRGFRLRLDPSGVEAHRQRHRRPGSPG